MIMAVAWKAQCYELVGQELHWSIETILKQRPSELLANHFVPLFLPTSYYLLRCRRKQ